MAVNSVKERIQDRNTERTSNGGGSTAQRIAKQDHGCEKKKIKKTEVFRL